jgi:phosphohistidine phosphatase SixA
MEVKMKSGELFSGGWKTFLLLSLIFISSSTFTFAEDDIWPALRSGEHVVLLRHALAPGTGDPAEFDVNDCATQRNLSKSGREQARRIGDLFRANGIDSAHIYSSQWCRCLETARLLGLGQVNELPIINSFFQAFHREEQQTRQLRQWLDQQDLSQPLVLVTHQVNITAMTGVFPASGELVVLHRDGDGQLRVVGTLETE